MFGVSLPEFIVLGTVALLVLGPEKLPGMLRTMGQWIAKIRRLTTEVRYQSGIDEVLRAEGFDGGLNELRSMMRGGVAAPSHTPARAQPPPVQDTFVSDKSREYPSEGPDACGALPEDLVAPAAPAPASAALTAAPEAAAPEAKAPMATDAVEQPAAVAAGPAVAEPVVGRPLEKPTSPQVASPAAAPPAAASPASPTPPTTTAATSTTATSSAANGPDSDRSVPPEANG